MAAELEEQVESSLVRREHLLVDAPRRTVEAHRPAHVGDRGAPNTIASPVSNASRAARGSSARSERARPRRRGEPVEVERREPELVSGLRVSKHRFTVAVRVQGFAHRRDVLLQCVVGAIGEGLVPEERHEGVGGDDAIVVKCEGREQGPLLGAAQVERVPYRARERSEDVDVEPDHEGIIAGRRAGPTGLLS